MRFIFSVSIIGLLQILSQRASAQDPFFSADSAYAYMIKQCAFGPRNPGSEGYLKCRDWLIEHLKSQTLEVYRQPFTANEALTGQDRRLTNIIARFDGAGSSPLALCAHWDTRAHADLDPNPDNRQSPILGANDGASGVAVLLEIARLAAAYPPPRPLLIIFFDGEDMGRATHPEEFARGSHAWAAAMIPEQPAQAILLDMIGDRDLEIPQEGYSLVNAPHLVEHLWTLASELELPAFVNTIQPPVADDHLPLINTGVEAVDIIDFDYPWWHTLEDTPDKCSLRSLEQVGRLLVRYIWD